MRRVHMLIIAGVVLVAAAGVLTLGRTLRHPSAVAEMRAEVADLRSAADACRAELEESHEALLRYNVRLDSMRGRVRELEGLHPRGVPADSYPVYIELFRSYNDSAGMWSGRVDSLQADLEACRTRADAYNAALDSLRALQRRQQR